MLSHTLFFWLACSSESTDVSDESSDTIVAEPQFVPEADDGASVESVDPARYLGVWYEIATTPSQQQAACAGTMAEYSLIDEDTIGVTNSCYQGSLDGRLNEINATARPLDDTYARLMVDFGFGFEAPYTVIDLWDPQGDAPYTYATVTSAGYQYWILSRTPEMPEDMYETMLERIDEGNGDSSRLILTEQPSNSDVGL